MIGGMFTLVILTWALSILVWIGRPYRWLRAHGFGRHGAALAQAIVLAGLWTIAWFSFEPSLNMSLDQVALFFAWMSLVTYGGILLRIRQMRAP